MFSCWTKRKTKKQQKQLSLSQRGDNNGRQDQSNIRIRQQTRKKKKKKKPRSGQTQSIQRTKNGRQTAFERIVESGKALINFIGVTASILMTLKIERRLRCSIFSLWRYLIKKESPIFISSCFVLFNRQPCIFFFILLFLYRCLIVFVCLSLWYWQLYVLSVPKLTYFLKWIYIIWVIPF